MVFSGGKNVRTVAGDGHLRSSDDADVLFPSFGGTFASVCFVVMGATLYFRPGGVTFPKLPQLWLLI